MSGNGQRGIPVRFPVQEEEIVPVTDEQIFYAAERAWIRRPVPLEARLQAVIDCVEPLIRRRLLGEVLYRIKEDRLGKEPIAIVRRMIQDIGE